MRKIGIMGGTFDPIHIGHLALAQFAMDEEGLDEVWFVPTGCSYMKKDREVLSSAERYEMTRLAALGNPRMRCLDIEIKRDGYSYSYETLEELKKEYPGEEFFFLFGADCLFAIETWKHPERIFSNAKIIAAVRNGADIADMGSQIEKLRHKYGAEIKLLPFLNLEISSTDLRERVRNGKSIRYLVPDKVLYYIEEKGFYRNEK
ncbi:MAG: nicotinate-nucleotide adenylyltransferase [Bacteroidales bacterium]|nr:nicotinate-nucleotide adenylyltransferase [Lachnoclostridium sp.]MCM1382961.1 nicotinate-nucleotide adenylyltransferase [Lachnoclostridium sp.]MCM1463986.1 nicotinate-nucleotide adenylyltransferase [Bacteroidales bacterium]